MVLRSGRDASTRPQVKAVRQPAPNEQSNLGSSRLTSTSALDSASEAPQRSSATAHPDGLGQKIPRASLDPPGSASNSSGGESLLPSLGSRRSRGTLQSRHGTIRSGRSQVLGSPGIRNSRHGSSSPGDSSDGTPSTERPWSSARSGTSFSRIADRLRSENPGESLREIRKRLASLEKEKELVSLTRKLNEMEAEKAAGFPDSQSSVFSESPEEALIRRQIIQESKLTVPLVKAYSGSNYAAYQFHPGLRACFSYAPRYLPERRG